MRRALAEYQVIGVRTTLPFARWLMEHPRYLAGDMSTDFIAEEWDTRDVGAQFIAPEVAAIVGGLLMNEQVEAEKLRRRPLSENGAETSRWRDAGRRGALRNP